MIVLDDNNSYVEPAHSMVTLAVVTTWCSQIDACRWCSWSLGELMMIPCLIVDDDCCWCSYCWWLWASTLYDGAHGPVDVLDGCLILWWWWWWSLAGDDLMMPWGHDADDNYGCLMMSFDHDGDNIMMMMIALVTWYIDDDCMSHDEPFVEMVMTCMTCRTLACYEVILITLLIHSPHLPLR